jgi:threonine efflux protein
MSYLLPLGGLALANFLGIISPGPAFVMVTRAAAGKSRGAGFGLAMGVAIAATSWAAAASFGIAVLMAKFSSIYGMVQLAGGAYLIWLGISAWREAGGKIPGHAADGNAATSPGPNGIARSVLVGAMLSLGNPKIVIFFSSIFVALLPAHAPLWVRLAAVAIVGLQEVTWYTMVAFLFSRPRAQTVYRRLSKWVERVMGTVLIGFGTRILTTVRI